MLIGASLGAFMSMHLTIALHNSTHEHAHHYYKNEEIVLRWSMFRSRTFSIARLISRSQWPYADEIPRFRCINWSLILRRSSEAHTSVSIINKTQTDHFSTRNKCVRAADCVGAQLNPTDKFRNHTKYDNSFREDFSSMHNVCTMCIRFNICVVVVATAAATGAPLSWLSTTVATCGLKKSQTKTTQPKVCVCVRCSERVAQINERKRNGEKINKEAHRERNEKEENDDWSRAWNALCAINRL